MGEMFVDKKENEDQNWYEQVLHSRREVHPFYFILDSWRTPRLTLRKKFGKIYTQAILSFNEISAILIDVKKYGSIIKAGYSLSITKQLFQQLYLFFGLGVRSKNYRSYLLFKSERWKISKKFTYRQVRAQVLFISNTYPKEKDILENKLKFYKHCLKYGLNTPAILAAYINQQEILNGNSSISLPAEDIFIKVLQGAQGYGASRYFFQKSSYHDFKGKSYTADGLIDFIVAKSHAGKDFIVQPAIKNHKDWQDFTTGALATCRIVSARTPEGEIIILAATLRMPTGRAITDNFDTGGVASPINLQTGELGRAVSMEPREGRFEFDNHPDTSRKITGTILPHWKELVEFTVNVHSTFKTIFIGWDISYTSNGFMVVEGNITWTPGVIESPQGFPLLETNYPLLFNTWSKKFMN